MSIKFILEHDQINKDFRVFLLLIGHREFKKVLSVFTTAAANKNFKEQIMLRERKQMKNIITQIGRYILNKKMLYLNNLVF